jgi:archaeal preflagellin peptidase FlaK
MAQEIFALARVAVTLGFLMYASWSDYKTREVSNKVWAVYAPIALALTLAELFLFRPDLSWLSSFGLSVGLTVGFAFILFYTGAFGGADSKAFMCIAVALPFFPVGLVKPLLPDGLSPLSQILFPITVLSNSVLVAAASAVYLLFRNLAQKTSSHMPLFEGTLANESVGKKLIVLVTGQKFSLATLKAKWHIYPLEDIAQADSTSGDLQRKLVIIPKDEGRDETLARLSKAADEGKIGSKVWATPGLPMLIFVTVGLVLALTLGDIVWIVVAHLFG